MTGEDSGELIAAAYLTGVPHPPGYPLWCLLVKPFFLIPYGDLAWRIKFRIRSFQRTYSRRILPVFAAVENCNNRRTYRITRTGFFATILGTIDYRRSVYIKHFYADCDYAPAGFRLR